MKEMKPPQTMNDLVVPEELKNVTNENRDIGDHMFLIYDSKTDDPSDERIIIFASYSMGQRAAIERDNKADGTFWAVPKNIEKLKKMDK